MSDMTELLTQVNRLGVPGHAHASAKSDEACPAGEVCIREAYEFTAKVTAPDEKADVYVDSMTAFEVLGDLPEGAGLEPLWAALVEIDHGS